MVRELHRNVIIDNCFFPDDLLYDMENFVWVDISNKNSIKLGITPIMSSISGRVFSVKLKEKNIIIAKGKSVGSIESLKYFGIVRSPISGKIETGNNRIIEKPKLVNDSPYEQGWFVTIYPTNLENELKYLKNSNDCREEFKIIIKDLNVRCFKYFPDYELYEIGSECLATLMKLDDLFSRIKVGEIVYLVSDDVTADIELQRWSLENSQSVVDIRKEKNLFHFLIRKQKDV